MICTNSQPRLVFLRVTHYQKSTTPVCLCFSYSVTVDQSRKWHVKATRPDDMHTECIVAHLKKQVFDALLQPVALRSPDYDRAGHAITANLLAYGPA